MKTYNPTIVYDENDSQIWADMTEAPCWHDGLWVLRSEAQAEIERLRLRIQDLRSAMHAAPRCLEDPGMVEIETHGDDGWKPIETVPTEQQVLLCCHRDGNTWITIGFVFKSAGYGIATHWMPMPKLPKSHEQRPL